MKTLTTPNGTEWKLGERFKVEVMDGVWETFTVTSMSKDGFIYEGKDSEGPYDCEVEMKHIDHMGFRKV